MKQLFIDGMMALEHVPVVFMNAYEDIMVAFRKSSARIDDTIELYDIKQVDKTDFFYMYRLPQYGGKAKPEDIERNFINILDGNFEGLVNDPAKFYTALEKNSIFWDVLNDVILIKGIENIEPLYFGVIIDKLNLTNIGKEYKYTEKEAFEYAFNHEFPFLDSLIEIYKKNNYNLQKKRDKKN